MDTSDPAIAFDARGECSHCRTARQTLSRSPFSLSAEERAARLQELVDRIRRQGAGNRYDCVIGLSGGVDSSYVALRVRDLKLRPLAVHLDNGWDSELSVGNIERLCRTLDIDLLTEVLDWEEFKDLQLAFLRSSTPDSEIPSDHAIVSTMLAEARKHRIGHVVAGTNWATESIMPAAWSQGHDDWRYIRGIQKRFGTRRLRTFPHRTRVRNLWEKIRNRVRWVDFLDYLDYDKNKAKREITERIGWRDYGRKHGESTYTRIYQEYILPKKFGFDKRRAHLSSLIVAGQLTRSEALEMLRQPLYDARKLEEDLNYLTTKFGISRQDFDRIMSLPPRSYDDYPNSKRAWWYQAGRRIYGWFAT
jgi:N-acetyl sugar amidotransferase